MKIYSKITGCIVAVVFLFTYASCSDDDDKLTDKEITKFTLQLKDGGTIEGVQIADDTIAFRVTPDYDYEKLKDATAKFYTSPKAIVSPYPSTPQDYSENVTFTVTAEDGSTKKWIIKHYYGKVKDEGFGYVMNPWVKSNDDLGLGANLENAIAYIGDNLVLARTGLMYNKLTGEAAGTLNVEGVISGNAGSPAPFILTNDDKGNLVGSTLTAWGSPYRVYKWSAANQAPVEIMAYTVPAGESYGRRLVVIGDVNGDGYIISNNNAAGSNGKHTRWKITGGVVNPVPDHIYETGILNTGGYQVLNPVTTAADSPYYISDSGSNSGVGARLYYQKDGQREEIRGPLTGATAGLGAWGNRSVYHMKPFTFRNKSYVATLHADWSDYYTTIYEREADGTHKKATMQVLNYTGYANTNGTLGLSICPSADGESMYVYSFMTSRGIACYQLTKYEE